MFGSGRGRARLSVGALVRVDGEAWRVVQLRGDRVALERLDGLERFVVDLATLMLSEGFGVLDGDLNAIGSSSLDHLILLESLPERQQEKVWELAGHIREMRTGFSKGMAGLALQGEPRKPYDPETTTLDERLDAKVKELASTPLARSRRTLQRDMKALLREGPLGLARRVAKAFFGPVRDVAPEVYKVLLEEMDRFKDESLVSIQAVWKGVEDRLSAEHPEVLMPSRDQQYRLFADVRRSYPEFRHMKTARSVFSRPPKTYRPVKPTRPGELVQLDSTIANNMVRNGVTGKLYRPELTAIMDVATRTILALIVNRSTKSEDLVLALRDAIRPKPAAAWSDPAAHFNVTGLPIERLMPYFPDLDPDEPVAAAPFILPETLVADHGKIYTSTAFVEAAIALGCNILPARPATGVDKSQLERWFGTLNEIMELLPGWVGRNTSERGTDAWDEDELLLDSEYETILRYWVFARYHNRKHDGLVVDGQPKMTLTPMEAYSLAVARTGFVAVPANRRWEYELLPTEWRTIQAYGVEFEGLSYDAEVLDPFRGQPYPLGDGLGKKWPFKVDRRDLRNIFFLDPTSEEWHAIPWMHQPDVEVPFPESSLKHLKAQAAEMFAGDASEADLADVFFANVKGYVVGAWSDSKREDDRRRVLAEAVAGSLLARQPTSEHIDNLGELQEGSASAAPRQAEGHSPPAPAEPGRRASPTPMPLLNLDDEDE